MFFRKASSLNEIAFWAGRWLAHATIGPAHGELLIPFGVDFSLSFLMGASERMERFVVESAPMQIDIGASAQIAPQWLDEHVNKKGCLRALTFVDGIIRVDEKRQDALIGTIVSVKDKTVINLLARYDAITPEQAFSLHTPIVEIRRVGAAGILVD